jgi:hypothetical protein
LYFEWQDMDLKEIVCEGVEWVEFVHDRIQRLSLVNTVMTYRVP